MTTEANAPSMPDTPATLGDLNTMAEAIMVELHAVEARLIERMDRMEARMDGMEARMDGMETRMDDMAAQLGAIAQAVAEIKDMLAR